MFKGTAILPGRFDPDAFSREMIKQMEIINDGMEKDFKATVRTWSDPKPRFTRKVNVSQGLIEGHVRTARIHGGKPREAIYYMVNNGTKVRYAKMTDDWQPKTRVGIIGSFTGRGGLERIDRIGRPGVKARKFDVAIALKYKALLKMRLRIALRNGTKASGHALP